MQTLIWAIGSMAVLMLIISLLPLGYTLKGKFFVVLASFILSLGGLAAASTFPMWETVLMLLGLIFFTSYFMNNRMGTLLFKESSVHAEIFDTRNDENFRDANFVDISDELAIPDLSIINLEKDSSIELSSSPVKSANKEIAKDELGTIDEDISFLLVRNTEVEINKPNEKTNLGNGYLSEIESLLVIETESEQEDLIEESDELTPIILVEKSSDQNGEGEEFLDDSLFDFLLEQKEVDTERNTVLEKMAVREKVSLQK